MQFANSQKSNARKEFCTKILAWVLLSIGILCIIAPAICIIVSLSGVYNNDDFDQDTDNGIETDDKLGHISGFSRPLIETLGVDILDTLVEPSEQGCFAISCGIDCRYSRNIYKEIAAIMNARNCEVFSSLVVSNLIADVIEDRWIDVNSTVAKIVLYRNQLSKIKIGAFNSPIFAKVVHMNWLDLDLNEISTGALLGLYSLRKLELDFNAPNIEITFLQPVQVTLTHLRMNCGISFNSNSDIFDNIKFEKLKYLDLSHNIFVGPLSKRIFHGTPNVAYLYLKYCRITAIDDDALEDIGKNLILVDLKNNFLTQINADLLGIGDSLRLFDVEPNYWNCNCQLRSLIKFYDANKRLFISTPYCRTPLNLYGKMFDELADLERSCGSPFDYDSDSHIEPTPTETTTEETKPIKVEPTKTVDGTVLKFNCSPAIYLDETSENIEKRDTNNKMITGNTFEFESPPYDLKLELLPNNSVLASIDGYLSSDELNIIWFTEDVESYSSDTSEIDYNCMQYENPYLTIDPLRTSYTYTFCMMSPDVVVISPLFCQPLHVPISHDGNEPDEYWTDETEKQFTIGMLCLIFFISTTFGAIFAYMGIKSFPHLLEGSKNVLVVKESEKTCRVSTIADSQYMKSSFKNGYIHDNTFNTRNHKLADVFTGLGDSQLASPVIVGSSSTYFEESFSNFDLRTIDYEMPMQFNTERSKLSECLDRPNSPPPLPKRNSILSLHKDQPLETCENP